MNGSARAARQMALARVAHGGRLLRRSSPFLLAGLFLFLAREPIAALDWRDVARAAGAAPGGAWLLAVCATAISFLALGHYDQAVHAALGTRVSARLARRSGMAAIAISQMAGAGLLTGTLTRWRLVPELSLHEAGRVTLCVTLSFLASWAVLTSAAIHAFLPDAGLPLTFAADAALVAAGLYVALCLLWPRLALPPLRLSFRMIGLAAVDTLAAALALYAFLPEASGFGLFLPAFLLALGAGLLLGTPGGIGPFELTLVAFLPGQDPENTAAAILCYRLVYFVAPAVIAGAATLLTAPGTDEQRRPAQQAGLPPRSGPAEMQLLRQGLHRLFLAPGAEGRAWLTARAGQVQVALLDPAPAPSGAPAPLTAFSDDARGRGLAPCLYKIGSRTAAFARLAGWQVHPLAEELWLCPATFSPEGPDRARLRRKLRHAARAGLRLTSFSPDEGEKTPWADLARLNRDWVARHGRERGFSMGRYAQPYLAGQRLYLAYRGDKLTAFIIFHLSEREWALDLVRPGADATDGTVHALIVAALADARAEGVARLSLAAAPLPALGLTGWPARLSLALIPTLRSAGLRQFKDSFAPCRRRLYIAARGRLALLWAGIEVARAIHDPATLPRPPAQGLNAAHDLPEKLAFDVS